MHYDLGMADDDRDMSARITDEGIEKMRVRIGVPMEMPPPFNLEAHPDTMRHFCYGYGDDNPLYADAEYGRSSRWGSAIGAPFYVGTLGRSTAPPMPADIRQRSRGALAGVGMFYAGSDWRFTSPIRPGDRVHVGQTLTDVSEQASKTFQSRTVRTDRKVEYTRESDGTPIAEHRYWFFHVERSAGVKTREKRRVDPPSYTDEEIEEIEQSILAEQRRGSEPRWLEDVRVGDSIGTVTKGPLRVSDILAWHIGNGPGENQWGAMRIMSQTRKRVPGFFTKNDYGVWDLVQRLHWDPQWANRIGLDRPYDYGPMRNTWMGHLVTDWMGDDAWLLRLTTRINAFNYQGDLTRVSGTVTAVDLDNGLATVEITGVNQRGETTCSGEAWVALPRRQGHASVPDAASGWVASLPASMT